MLKLCLLLGVVVMSFPGNAMAETCSFFAQQVQTSFDDYIRVKNSSAKQAGSSASFNIVGAENDVLQNLNNKIQIYRNLNCDVNTLRQGMENASSGSKRGSIRNDRR